MARSSKNLEEAPIQIAQLVVLQNSEIVKPDRVLTSLTPYEFQVTLEAKDRFSDTLMLQVLIAVMLRVAVTDPERVTRTVMNSFVLGGLTEEDAAIRGGRGTSLKSEVLSLTSETLPITTVISPINPWGSKAQLAKYAKGVAQLQATATILDVRGKVKESLPYIFTSSLSLARQVQFENR